MHNFRIALAVVSTASVLVSPRGVARTFARSLAHWHSDVGMAMLAISP